MDVETIFTNVKRMLDYRVNSHRIKFNVCYAKFDGDSGNATDKVTYSLNSYSSGGHVAEYKHNNRVYKTVYLNIDINQIKSLVDEPDAIILHASNDRKIKKLIKLPHLCQFFDSSMFLTDYRSNIYFTYICKSDERVGDTQLTSNLQYISSRDFSIMYCGLREGDIALAISIVDPTLVLPQLRIVKRDTTDDEDQQQQTNDDDKE